MIIILLLYIYYLLAIPSSNFLQNRYIYLYKEYSDNKQTRKQVKKTHVKKRVIVEDTSGNKEGEK